MPSIVQVLRNLGPKRLAIIGGVMVCVIGFFVWVFAEVAKPNYALLFGDLDPGDSARVISHLESAGIPHELRHDGGFIYVPSDQVLRTRMALAEQGLPSGGSIGYEIFDNSDALGTTNFTQNVNLVRALEGELARTIRSIESVKSARVHLVLPKRELFARDRQEPSASVLLQLRGANSPSRGQVAAIQRLVASAIPDLNPRRVSIIDDTGTLLTADSENDDATALASSQADERRRRFETNLARTVEQLLAKTVGLGKVRTEVFADMDFDRINTSEEVFDPDSQVVRSTQAVEQSGSNQEGTGGLPVSVGTNLPDSDLGLSESGGSSASENRTEETVNYEISKKVINHVRETGEVKRLSVAVLVDGTYILAEDGSKTYQPRAQQELDLLATLVRGAIGFDAERGNSVEVINMRFADMNSPAAEETGLFLGLEKEDLFRIGQYLVLVVLGVLVLFLVVRPLVKNAAEAIPVAAANINNNRLTGGSARAALPPPDSTDADGQAKYLPASAGSQEGKIDVNQVDGRVNSSAVKRVGEIVEKHPDEALTIVRGWLHAEQ